MDLQQYQSAKLVLLGDMGAGKSSLVLRYVKGTYFDDLVGQGTCVGKEAVHFARTHFVHANVYARALEHHNSQSDASGLRWPQYV